MKTFITILATATVTTIISGFLTSLAFENYYEEYHEATDNLLMMLEETDELNGIPWGDTICETDVWEEFCEAREKIGLGYLDYYGNVK